MMQPPRSAVTLQPQPLSGVSWFIPKLCPSSWARVTAAPRGLSEWSYNNNNNNNKIISYVGKIVLPPVFTEVTRFTSITKQ